jgi:CheY-like chemotaxis protein
LKTRRILVVGSRSTKFAASAPALQRQGFEIDRVSSPGTALELARNVSFHFALLDDPASDVSVEALAQALATAGPSDHRPRIALVASADAIEGARAYLGKGVDAVLSADSDPEDAAQVLHGLLGAPPRLSARLPVRLEVSLDEGLSLVFRQTENLSRTGMLVRSPRALPPGTEFSFKLDLPDERHPIEGRAEVVRHVRDGETNAAYATGMRFLSFKGDGESRIQAFVDAGIRGKA